MAVREAAILLSAFTMAVHPTLSSVVAKSQFPTCEAKWEK
jgi:hypothetical protein